MALQCLACIALIACPISALLSSGLRPVARTKLSQRPVSYDYETKLMSTVVDASVQPPSVVDTPLKPKIKFKITPVQWVDLMSVVSLRVITFYPELCQGGSSNEAIKQKIMNKMIQRGNEGSMNFMAQEEGGFFYRNLLGAVEVSPTDFRGTVMEKIGASKKLYLVDLCIRKDFRNMGIASSLLRAAEESALQKGFMEIYMHVEVGNTVARNLYEKNGYSVVPLYEWAVKFTESRLKKPAEGYLLLLKSLTGVNSMSGEGMRVLKQ